VPVAELISNICPRSIIPSEVAFEKENPFRLDKRIHNKNKVKIVGTAYQIENPQPLNVSPDQSTFWWKFTTRASTYTSIGCMIYGLFHLAIYIFSFFDNVKPPSN
jgi:hypothetical protein